MDYRRVLGTPGGLRPAVVLGVLDAVVAHLAFDDARGGAAAALGEFSGEDLLAGAGVRVSQRVTDETGRRPDIPSPSRYMSTDFLRPAYWRLRGKFDVPNERLISYSYIVPDDEAILGWAGWNHIERARVLIDLIESRKRNDHGGDLLIPLLAGLKELQSWVRQWHGADEVIEYLDREQSALGLSDRDLTSWRPPKPRRGRPRQRPLT